MLIIKKNYSQFEKELTENLQQMKSNKNSQLGDEIVDKLKQIK